MNLSLNEVSSLNSTPFNKRMIAVVAAIANLIKSSTGDFKVKTQSSRQNLKHRQAMGILLTTKVDFLLKDACHLK